MKKNVIGLILYAWYLVWSYLPFIMAGCFIGMVFGAYMAWLLL